MESGGRGYVGKKKPQAGVVSAWGVRYEKSKMLVLRRRSSDYFGGNLGFVKRVDREFWRWLLVLITVACQFLRQ